MAAVTANVPDTAQSAQPEPLTTPVQPSEEAATSAAQNPALTTSEAAKTSTSTPAVESSEKTTEPSSNASAPAVVAATTAATTKSIEPIQELWNTAKASGHPEIWGVNLADPATHIPTQIVLQKYLNANDGDLTKAKGQLTKTLEWRSKMKPLELINKRYSTAKFDGLGYVTTYVDGDHKEVFTWNIYGGVKKIAETFGNLEEFIEWRVALMEIALQDLSIGTATTPITATEDPYKIFQVHDYKSISFFRSPPEVRTASKETITVFAQNYPELLKEKFFVNVPAVMGFMYGIIKVFAAAKTVKKFHPMSDGTKMALEFGDSKVTNLGEKLPKEYGGKGEELRGNSKEPALE